MDSPPHFFTGPETLIVKHIFYEKYIFPANYQFVNNKVKECYYCFYLQLKYNQKQKIDNGGAQVTSY